MRVPAGNRRPGLRTGAALSLAALCLSSCANSVAPAQFRSNFLPPPQSTARPVLAGIDPPELTTLAFFANEVPNLATSLSAFSRFNDVEVLIRRADERFSAGKKAYQEGRQDAARHEFDRVLEVLLTAPENLSERSRLEQHIEGLIESIYRYDVDQNGPSQTEAEISFEKSPIDDLLQMTFPIDPSLRGKVQEQIRVTASQLPLEENDAVVSYINFFSSPRGKKILAFGLHRSGLYKAMIERTLREEGIPEELIFLAQAESGFTPRARSIAKCVGVWQFATFRGKEYGLNQTASTDDRMDPELATRAAAHHLHDLYNHFGDWYLAMAAYNCGPGCVDRAIQRTGYADFWQLRRLGVLPKETANYVPAILSMVIMAKNAKDYGLADVGLEKAVEYDTIEVESPTHLALVADIVDRPLAELRELNPSLLRLMAPAGLAVHVPKGTLPQVTAAFQVIPANRRDAWRAHRLDTDDTFATLAQRYSTTAAQLKSVNGDELGAAGSWIAVPVAYPGDRAPARTQAARTRITPSRAGAQASTVAKSGKTAPLRPRAAQSTVRSSSLKMQPKPTVKAAAKTAANSRPHAPAL